jgi:5-methylcytosine-specific restriction endonuclease McrA
MTVSSVKRLSNDTLRRDLRALVAHDRTTTVRLLIHIAEFDSRKLYRQDGYPSMFAYCVGELRMSEDVAYKRIRTARAARRFPRIFTGIADGGLTLSAVALLGRELTSETATDLLGAATGKTNDQIRQLLAERFPQPDLPTVVLRIESRGQLAVRPVLDNFEQPARCLPQPVSEHVEAVWRRAVKPLAPERFGVQFSIGREDRELLERAKDLLSHQIPSGDEAQVFLHALRALVRQLEKRKLGASDKPRKRSPRESKNPRYIPPGVRTAVHERDDGRCTFVGENGHRCGARGFLEFDHVLEVARGGRSTAENLRLRCRTHNQYTAEQTYGPGLINGKREEAARAAGRQRHTSP